MKLSTSKRVGGQHKEKHKIEGNGVMFERMVLKFLSPHDDRSKISNGKHVGRRSEEMDLITPWPRLNDNVLSFIKNGSCLVSCVYPSLVNRTIVTIVKVG